MFHRSYEVNKEKHDFKATPHNGLYRAVQYDKVNYSKIYEMDTHTKNKIHVIFFAGVTLVFLDTLKTRKTGEELCIS